MAIEPDIYTALSQRVATIPGGLPIAWPNVKFTRPGSGEYLEVAFIPNTALRLGVNTLTPHRHLGLLQVSAWAPRNSGAPIASAGRIVDHFPADLVLTAGSAEVRVTKTPDMAGMIVDDNLVQIPVTIDWEVFN